MNKNFKVIKILALLGIIIFLCCYFSFLFFIPNLLNSKKYVSKYENFLYEKTGLPVKISNFKLKTYPNLEIKISADKISSDTNTVNIENISYKAKIFNLKHGKLNSDYLFLDIPKLRKYIKISNQNAKTRFNLKYLPVVNIKNSKIQLSQNTSADIKYIKSNKHHSIISINLLAKIINPYTKSPVIIGKNGQINYGKNINFENFSAQLDNSEIFLSGDLNNLKIKGHDLPVRELEQSFLYFYKLKNPKKKNFIENFSNFKGSLDVDLDYKNKIFTGFVIAKNLGADFSNFKIPVFLPNTRFCFENNTIKAKSEGTFGKEPVTTDFLLTGMMSDNLDVSGNVESVFTNKIVKTYYPNVGIEGKTPAKVTYHTHKGIVDVYYYLTVPQGNNLLTVWGDLDNTDKERKLYMHTQKHGNPIKIKDYHYSVKTPSGYQKIIYGDGLFDKLNGKYTLYNLNVKSNGKVSVNYIKSFLKDYVKKGTFDADLKLDFIKKELLGYMNLYDVSNDNVLYLKTMNLKVDKNKITLNTQGSFYNYPISASASLDNKFQDKINIRSIDIHLNGLYLARGKLESIPKSFKNDKHKMTHLNKKKKLDISVEQGRVIVDRVYGRKFDVRNVNIQGSLQNDIAHFIVPKADYAKGLLSAKGIYNIANHSSNIEFFASDIDSNEVATHIFKLPDQIQGNAFATLHIITKDKFNDIKAKATFAVSNGFLPKIGNQEFMVGKSKNKKHTKKLTLSKITNIDFSKPNIFYSNLYGSFNIDNEEVKNVKIFSKSDYLGLYIEGNYNTDNENGDINIFGRRNKTQAKKIRIFKIPINLIYRIVFRPEHSKDIYDDKIQLIPQIKSSIMDEISIFRVSVQGNFNHSDKMKVTLKDLR